jgi:hypothetical protein
MKKLIISGLAMFMSLTSVMAQEETGIGNHLGWGVGFGTEGFNASIATDLTQYAELEFGVNWAPGFARTENGDAFYLKDNGDGTFSRGKDAGNMDIKAKVNRATLDFKGSVYPLAANEGFASDLFVAVGVSFASKELASIEGTLNPDKDAKGNDVDVRVGKYLLPLDKNANGTYSANASARVNSVRPYLGLGYGRLVPKNNLGFRVELGCQFDGKVKLYKNDEECELLSKYGFESANSTKKVMDFFSIYPVLKFSLRGKFF